VYTQRFNRTHGFDGQLFRGRYKSIIVDGDSYLLQLVRYIHRNPLRAGVADAIHKYPWSSHKGYLSSAKKWSWLHKDFIFSLFSNVKTDQLKAYKAFMHMEDSEEITHVLEGKKRPIAFGDEKFVNWLKVKFFVKNRNPQIPESLKLAPEIEEIKNTVCSFYNIDESELLKSRRGRFSEPRNMAIYLARMLRIDSLLDIGSEFGLKGYSSVSSVVVGMKKKLQNNRKMKKRYDEIEKAIFKGQTET